MLQMLITMGMDSKYIYLKGQLSVRFLAVAILEGKGIVWELALVVSRIVTPFFV